MQRVVLQFRSFKLINISLHYLIVGKQVCIRRSQWQHSLRRRSAAALQGLRVRILRGAWMSVSCDVCCQIEVSATGRSLVQGSPTECSVSERVVEVLPIRRTWSSRVWMVLGRRKSLDPDRIRTPDFPVRR